MISRGPRAAWRRRSCWSTRNRAVAAPPSGQEAVGAFVVTKIQRLRRNSRRHARAKIRRPRLTVVGQGARSDDARVGGYRTADAGISVRKVRDLIEGNGRSRSPCVGGRLATAPHGITAKRSLEPRGAEQWSWAERASTIGACTRRPRVTSTGVISPGSYRCNTSMTYCVGWKYRDAVFLLADTAVTKSARPSTTHSSFGQLHAEVRGEHVEEGLLKLVPLGPGTVAAFAGDVGLATSCLDFLRDALPTATSTSGLLQALTLSLAPFPTDRAVEILIAVTDAESCELIHWDTLRGIDPADSDYYQLGSLTSYHADLTPAHLSQLVARNLPTDRMLSVATALVQSYGVHDDLIPMNVGGLVFGVQSRRGVVTWQQDTKFVLYDPAFGFRAIIAAIARDNTLVLSSSINNHTRLLGHPTSMPRADLWSSDWLRDAEAVLTSGHPPLWVFISTAGRVITLIFRTNVANESRYVTFKDLGGGKFDLALSPELMALLQQPLEDRNDGSLPFRLNVRND